MWAFGVIFAIFGIIYVYARSAFEIGNKFTTDRRTLPWKVQKQIIELARPVKNPPKEFTWYDILNIHAPQNKWLFEDIKDDLKYIFRDAYNEDMTFINGGGQYFPAGKGYWTPETRSAGLLIKLLEAKYYGSFSIEPFGVTFGGRLLNFITCDKYAKYGYFIPKAGKNYRMQDEDYGWIIIRYLQRISYYLSEAGKSNLGNFISISGCMVDFPEEVWIKSGVNDEIQVNRKKPTISGSITLEILTNANKTSEKILYPYLEYELNPEWEYVLRAKEERSNRLPTNKAAIKMSVDTKTNIYALATLVLLILMLILITKFLT